MLVPFVLGSQCGRNSSPPLIRLASSRRLMRVAMFMIDGLLGSGAGGGERVGSAGVGVESARDREALADDVRDGPFVAGDERRRRAVDRVDGQGRVDAFAEEAGDADDPAVE